MQHVASIRRAELGSGRCTSRTDLDGADITEMLLAAMLVEALRLYDATARNGLDAPAAAVPVVHVSVDLQRAVDGQVDAPDRVVLAGLDAGEVGVSALIDGERRAASGHVLGGKPGTRRHCIGCVHGPVAGKGDVARERLADRACRRAGRGGGRAAREVDGLLQRHVVGRGEENLVGERLNGRGLIDHVRDVRETVARDGVLSCRDRENDIRTAKSFEVVSNRAARRSRERKRLAGCRKLRHRRPVGEVRPVGESGELAIAGGARPGVPSALLGPQPFQLYPSVGGGIVGIPELALMVDSVGTPGITCAVVLVKFIADALPRCSIDVRFRRGAEFVDAVHRVEAMWLHALQAVVLRADDDSVPAEAHLVHLAVLRHFCIRKKPAVDAQGMHRPLRVMVFVRSADPVFQRRYGIV